MRKYNNKKVHIGELKFDSQLEADYYTYLQENKNELGIIDIQLQYPFLLIDTIKYHETTYRKRVYKCDFRITYKDGLVEVIDVKGFETDVFKIKRQLLLERYPNINFWCVKKLKGKWIKS